MKSSAPTLPFIKAIFTQVLSMAAFGVLLAGADWAAAAERTVSIRDNFFSPRSLTIQPGDTVKWVQDGNSTHTTTSKTGLWDSGVLHNGDTFSFTFTNLGRFPYFCQVHGQSMSGTITVSSNTAAPLLDLFLVNLAGKCRTTNAEGKLVVMGQNSKHFVEDCAEENTREAADLALVYNVQTDAIEVVDRASGSNVCTLATFVGGVTLPSPDGTQREKQAFVFWEDSTEANGSMTATEHSTRGAGDELLKFSLRGSIQFGITAYDDEPSKIFAGSFSTGRRFAPAP